GFVVYCSGLFVATICLYIYVVYAVYKMKTTKNQRLSLGHREYMSSSSSSSSDQSVHVSNVRKEAHFIHSVIFDVNKLFDFMAFVWLAEWFQTTCLQVCDFATAGSRLDINYMYIYWVEYTMLTGIIVAMIIIVNFCTYSANISADIGRTEKSTGRSDIENNIT